MTDEELNEWLHINIMKECWHEPKQKSIEVGLRLVPCIHCSEHVRVKDFKRFRDYEPGPNYCMDLNAVAEVETKVIERVGELIWHLRLMSLLPGPGLRTVPQSVRATARYRAEACKLAWESVP